MVGFQLTSQWSHTMDSTAVRCSFAESWYDLVTSSGVSVDLIDILINWVFIQANVKHALNPLNHLKSSVPNAMVNVVIKNPAASKHTFYFDDFFTNYDLLNDLGKKGIKVIRTARENRTQEASKVSMDRKSLKKSDRGTFDFRCDRNVYFCKWNDKLIGHVQKKSSLFGKSVTLVSSLIFGPLKVWLE